MSKGAKGSKFVELAEKRVTNVISNLRLVGNLSNRNNYSYDSAQVKQIFDAIELELRLAKSKFQAGLKKEESKIFKLSGE